MPNIYKVWDESEPEMVITYGGEDFSARSTAPISTS